MEVRHVLIVTRERLLGDLLKDALSHREYTCVVETLPTLAAEQFRTTHPALTIVDLSSLDYDGLDVIAEIQRQDPNAVVTAIIGPGQAPLESTAHTLGVTDIIQRHDDLSHMLQLVKDLETQRGSSGPVTQPAVGAGGEPAGASVPIIGDHASVLVVDDDAAVRRLLERVLTRAGYSVLTASDGIEALECLERVTVQVMFLDLRMPRLGGIAVLRRLKDLQSPPRTVIISGLADSELKQEAIALGAFDYLQKPLSVDRVLVAASAAVVLESARRRSFWTRWIKGS